jgi:hypothetical protein
VQRRIDGLDLARAAAACVDEFDELDAELRCEPFRGEIGLARAALPG